MDEEDLRDCFAMFALNGLISRGHDDMLIGGALCKAAYDYADAMLEARNTKPDVVEGGIAAVVKQWDEPFVAQEVKPKTRRKVK